MADLGQAYVQIVPSAEGMSGSIEQVLNPEAQKAGTSAGKTVMSTLGGTMTSVGKGMTKFVTLPLAGVGAGAIAAFTDVHAGLENIITKTGTSGEALEDMRGILGNIAKQVPTDFGNIGDAIGEVNTRFGSTGEELEDLSSKFLKFADINGIDVTSAIDSVQSSMAAFGIDTQDTGAFLDTLNKVGQDTGVSVEQLANDLMTNAASLKEMGYSASDAANFVGNLNKNGINSSTVMAGLKKAFSKAAKEGKPMNKVLGELQESMQNAGSDTEAYQMALELFGDRAGPAIAEACRDGRLSFEELGTSLTDNLGNVESTFEATQTPLDKFKLAMNGLKDTGATVGSNLLEILTPAIEKIADVIQKVSDKWNSLSPQTQDMIIKIAMIAAAIGPVVMIVGKVIGTILSIQSAISGVSAAMTLLSGPIGIVIAIIGAAIAVGVLLYQNWDTICAWAATLKEKVVEAWNTIKDKVTGFVEELKEKVTTAWSTIKEKVVAFAESIKTNVKTAWETVKTNVTSAVDSIKSTVSTKFEMIKSKIATTWENVKSKTSTIWGNIKSTIEENGGGIQGIINTAMEGYKAIWQAGFDFLDSVSGGKLSAILGYFTEKFDSIKSHVDGVVSWLKGIFNFEWSLPHIKLPHFSITGSFSLRPPSVPHLSVSWYKTGAIFDEPSVIGVGEAGREAVVPLSGNAMQPFARAIMEEMGTSEDRRILLQLVDILLQYLPQMSNMQMVTDTGALVGQLAPAMDARMGLMSARRERNG